MKSPLFLLLLLPFLFFSCGEDNERFAPSIENRDSLPILKSIGVSPLISSYGIIRYKIISEDWYIYDKKQPTYWSFEKGLFIQRFNEQYHTDAFISADTAYYYDQRRLWELHGRVLVKNLKGETFRTSILFWDQTEHRIYSPAFMRIDGIENQLEGYNFSSNEQMTQYIIHNSKGATPMGEETLQPTVDSERMNQANNNAIKLSTID